MKKTVVLAVSAALMAGLGSTGLTTAISAQKASQGGIVIAIPVQFPQTDVDDAKAVIYRTGREEIILVNPAFSTPETLASCYSLLQKLRKERVEDGLTEASVVAGYSVRKPLKSQKRLTLSRTLEEISNAPISTLGNLGPGRWVLVPRGFGRN